MGKTDFMKKILKENIDEGKRKIIYLVPEQSSFETEKSLLNFLGEREFKFVNVLTFDRMHDFIFRKVGGMFSSKISSGKKNIFMSLAIEKAYSDLSLYKKSSDDIETVQMMVSALDEIKSYAISLEVMDKCCKSLNGGTLKQKLQELITIAQNYKNVINESFTGHPEDLELLLDAVKNTRVFEEYVLFVDDFINLNLLQLQILEELMVQSGDSFFAFTTDKNFLSESGVFAPVNRLLKKIVNLAKKNSLKIDDTIVLEVPQRFKNKDLILLEKNFFTSPKECCSNEPENIFLYNASDIYDECEFIARTIRKMVMENGFRYRDFALATRNMEEYTEKINNIFDKYEIPYFIDSPQRTEDKILFCAVFAAFEAVVSNFDSGTIFRYLKTGLSGIDAEETSLLENYVFLWRINADRWKTPFDMHPEGFSNNTDDSSKEKLEKIEKIRQKVIEPLIRLQNNIFGETGDKISLALYNFLEDIHISKNIREFCIALINAGKLTEAEQQSRIWDMLMASLDQVASALNGIHVKPKRYMELLRLAVQSEDISFIPEGLDEVMVSSVDKRKISKCKVVFVIGAVEGEFPFTPVSTGIFSNTEKRELASLGLEIYDDFEKMYETERFISYLAVSSASEYVFVSWMSSDLTGKIKFPSEIVKEIKSMFPSIKVMDKYNFQAMDYLWTTKSAFDICARDFNKNDGISLALRDYFLKDNNYKDKIESIACVRQKKEMKIAKKDVAKKLFGENIKVSASQIEKFYSCKFQYFCQYGLKAKERKRAQFNSLEYGSLIHFLLENLLKNNSKEQLLSLKEEDMEDNIEKLMEKYVENNLGGSKNKSSRFKYLFLRCKKAIKILLKRLLEEFSQSLFFPVDYELNISNDGEIQPLELSMPSGGKVFVQGKIDRVDIMKTAGKSYIRIIDYKTGQKKFKLCEVFYGLNMQMLLYMLTLNKNGKDRYGEIIPAGVLYMPAIYPLITAENGDSSDNLSEKLLKKMRMNGLILEDTRVVQGMEKASKGIFVPAVIKNGVLSGEESLASLEQIGIITKYIEKMVIDMAKNLHSGEIGVSPCEDAQNKACDWCPYSSVCGLENEESKNKLLEMKKVQVIEEMKKRISDESHE